ncbi:MAG: TonB family protein, partial [Bacteroidota bacterium]
QNQYLYRRKSLDFMIGTKVTDNKFDKYLQQIHAHQRVQRRRRFAQIALIMSILIGGFTLFQSYTQSSAPYTWRTFTHENLSEAKVATLLAEDSMGILVSHPLIGLDTLKGPADYIRFQELIALIEESAMDEAPSSSSINFIPVENRKTPEEENKSLTQEKRLSTENATLSPFNLRIRGSHRAGASIRFEIDNYDPYVRYRIDFGNGVIRQITSKTTYKYPLSGSYNVRLIATSVDRGSSVFSKRIRIAAPLESSFVDTGKKAKKKRKNLSNPDFDLSRLNDATEWTVPRSSSKDKKTVNTEKEKVQVVDLNKQTQKEEPKVVPVADLDDPLVFSDKMPHYPGGKEAMKQYLRRKLKYPQGALSQQIQGQVIVQFVVDPYGQVSQAKIIKGLGGGCDEEALRMVNNMPKWIPGENNGMRVPVYQSIPIIFKLYE